MTASDLLKDLRALDRQYINDCLALRRTFADDSAELHQALTARGERYDQDRTALLSAQHAEIDEALRILDQDDQHAAVSPAHSANARLAFTVWRFHGVGKAQR
jgi:hypothetical protein